MAQRVSILIAASATWSVWKFRKGRFAEQRHRFLAGRTENRCASPWETRCRTEFLHEERNEQVDSKRLAEYKKRCNFTWTQRRCPDDRSPRHRKKSRTCSVDHVQREAIERACAQLEAGSARERSWNTKNWPGHVYTCRRLRGVHTDTRCRW